MRVPYWGRLWIILEFLLARKLLLCYDEHTFKDEHLAPYSTHAERSFKGMACQPNADIRGYDKANVEMLHFCAEVLRAKSWRGDGPDLSPQHREANMHLLKNFGRSQCSVRLGKVYGLLGLMISEDPTEPQLQVDYSINKVELYFRALSCLSLSVSFPAAECLRRALQISPQELVKKGFELVESGSLSRLRIVVVLYLEGTVGGHWHLSGLPKVQSRDCKHSTSNAFYLDKGSLQMKDLLIRIDGTDFLLSVRVMEEPNRYQVKGIVVRYRDDAPHQQYDGLHW